MQAPKKRWVARRRQRISREIGDTTPAIKKEVPTVHLRACPEAFPRSCWRVKLPAIFHFGQALKILAAALMLTAGYRSRL